MAPSYAPTLHRIPDDTSGRFAVLREFLLRWHGIDAGPVGRTVARVDAAEARLGRRLPLAVREWIVLLDDLDRLDRWGDVLRDCWSLARVPGQPAFSLLVQGEDDYHWGPMLRDLEREDPPVHGFVLDHAGAASAFVHAGQEAPRVSTWALGFLVRYLYLSRSLQLERWIEEAALARLRRRPPPGVVATRIGRSVVFEFTDGLVQAEPDRQAIRLSCYAPYRDGTNEGYYSALEVFGQRLDSTLALSTK